MKEGEKQKSNKTSKQPGNVKPYESANCSSDAMELYKKVEEQGNLVRTLKSQDPKSEQTKAAIAQLLELKKLYKTTTGQEYKPNSPPQNTSSDEKNLEGDAESDPLALYKKVEEQGNLVRTLKSQDPKGEQTKAAISKLLELKKLYKMTSGLEYKAGSPPATQ